MVETDPLECFEHGSGQPVVLVHGSASDRRTWEHQVEAFAKSFRVINYSRRHHWPNERLPDGAEYSMSEQVDDLRRVLDALNGTRAHIVGHSYGAYLALIVAMKNPELVDRLVLGEAPVIPLFTSFPPKPYEILKLLLTRPRTALPIIKFAATGLGPATIAAKKGDVELAMKRFGPAVLGKEAFRSMSPRRLQMVRDNFEKAELLSGSCMTPLKPSEVADIKARTLLVTGDKSPIMFRRLTDRLEELIPNTARLAIPNASHDMHEDNPAAYNEAVLAFLNAS